MAKQKIIQSAKFKRDYVAVSAIAIFFAIVLSEVALAVSIPAYLKRENAMATEVRRLALLRSFDGARYLANRPTGGGDAREMEVRIIRWNLDQMAGYLRSEADNLDSDEIAQVQGYLKDMTRILTRLHNADQKTYCQERTLDASGYLNQLLTPEAGK